MITVGLDHTLFIQIVQFLVVVFLTNKLIVKPIKNTMDTRNAKIDALLADAEASMKTVEESRLAYEAKLREIKGEIADYQRKVQEETSTKVNAAITEAKAKISASSKTSQIELEQAVAEARQVLAKDVKDLGQLIYKTISGKAA